MMEKIDIKNASIAEEIRKQMAVATVTNKGLMSQDYLKTEKWEVSAASLVIYETTRISSIATSMMISIGTSGGGLVTTYHLTVNRAGNVLTAPNIVLNRIGGSPVPPTPRLKLFANTTNGSFKIISEHTAYTPFVYAKIMARNYADEVISMEQANPSEVSQATYIEVTPV